MGIFYVQSNDYVNVAKYHGPDVAQRLWELDGWEGKYVPGMVAVRGWSDNNGTVVGYADHKHDMEKLEQAKMSPVAQDVFGLGVKIMRDIQQLETEK